MPRIFLALVFLLAACSAEQQLPRSTPVAISTDTPTPTIRPTYTPYRGSYRGRATETLSPLDITSTVVAEKYCPPEAGRYRPALFSNSGQYVAVLCILPDTPDYSRTLVVRLADSKIIADIPFWKVLGKEYSTPTPDEVFAFQEYMALYPGRWASDDRVVYFTEPSPVSGYWYGRVSSLVRVEVPSGKLDVLLKDGGYTYEFSPDETILISVDQLLSPMTVVWKNLDNGQIKKWKLDPKYRFAGDYQFSPDGKKVIVSAAVDEAHRALILLDSISLTQHTLVDDVDVGMIEWLADNQIYIDIYSYPKTDTDYYYLDIDTLSITSAPTPTPEP